MAGAIGKRQDKELLNHLLGQVPDTTPAGVLFISLHTGNPGNDGQAGNEATGVGYARAPMVAADWAPATDAEPSVALNANAAVFPTAGGDWSGGANFTWIGLWATLGGTTEADFCGRLQLTEAKPVLNGDTAELAAGLIALSLD